MANLTGKGERRTRPRSENSDGPWSGPPSREPGPSALPWPVAVATSHERYGRPSSAMIPLSAPHAGYRLFGTEIRPCRFSSTGL